MQAGEGKTVACGLATIIRTILGPSVHVATTNEYLAERNYQIVAPAFDLLGISSGLLLSKSTPSEIRQAYRAQITYGWEQQFGFDYLRDQLSLLEVAKKAVDDGRDSIDNERHDDGQGTPNRSGAIILDDADCVLLDKASTPLLLGGEFKSTEFSERSSQADVYAGRTATLFKEGRHFVMDVEKRSVALTDQGFRLAQHSLVDYGRLELLHPWRLYIENALIAINLYHRDQHYVVQEKKIKLVDGFTGRIFDDRTLPKGLQDSLEVKEGFERNLASLGHARITRQHFFRTYGAICGMTGTAAGSEAELAHFYGLDVVYVDRHRSCLRKELHDRYFDTWDSKLNAIAMDVAVRNKRGQPILICTSTFQESQRVEQALRATGLVFVMLNGVRDAAEAGLIAAAGRDGRITVARNIAGNGTHVELSERARECGGLHVIGTQRHTSRRVDRQLVGRAGHRGEPGSTQFFISAEDDLLQTYGTSLAKQINESTNVLGESKVTLSGQIQRLQEEIEDRQFHVRRELVQHDNWLDNVQQKMSRQQATS